MPRVGSLRGEARPPFPETGDRWIEDFGFPVDFPRLTQLAELVSCDRTDPAILSTEEYETAGHDGGVDPWLK